MTSEPSPGREASALDVDSLIDAVGGTASLSHLIGVTPRQVARWRRGENQPRPRSARLLSDLNEVIARGTMLCGDRVVLVAWLNGSNTYLGGARPIDAVRLDRTPEVLAAIDEALSGAFA